MSGLRGNCHPSGETSVRLRVSITDMPTPTPASPSRKARLLAIALGWTLAFSAANQAAACTVFVLTDASRTLFFNNEDWSDPESRIWFVPAGEGHMGCAYVGFVNGWAQGGVNTQGVAFDWVAGSEARWTPASTMKPVRGNPSERMLETCPSVDDAIVFYQTHREPDFARAKILVADRTGASAIIGAKDGELTVERSTRSRGFGFGQKALGAALAKAPAATVADGSIILRACRQEGEFATKYSNAYDLRSGEIHLFPVPGSSDKVRLNLADELDKGPHHYCLPQIREQLCGPLLPLPPNLQRFFLDGVKPLADQEPEVARKIQEVICDAVRGTMDASDYNPTFWRGLASEQKSIQSELKKLGDLVSVTLVGREDNENLKGYRYLVDFSAARVLQRYDFDRQGKVVSIRSEAIELKAKGD